MPYAISGTPIVIFTVHESNKALLFHSLYSLLYTFRSSVNRQILAKECILPGQLMFSLEEWFLPQGDVGVPLHNASVVNSYLKQLFDYFL